MKKVSFATAPFTCLLCLAPFFCAIQLSAQHVHDPNEREYGCSHDAATSRSNNDAPPPWGILENFPVTTATPNISVVLDQTEGGAFLYEPVAAWTGSESGKAQVSLKIWTKNLETDDISWNKVVFEYVQNGVQKTVTHNFASLVISPNSWKSWQNSRDYHQVGNVLYLDAPIPASLTVKLYYEDYSTPLTITKPLAPYTQTYGMPFRAFNLDNNELWEGGSTHGGGTQVFAYDLTVYGLENEVWTKFLPNTDGSENNDFRVWGQPIYAMADGVVKGFNNTVPNNPAPGEEADYSGYTNGSAGNHFYIQHGGNIALYAHMQQGSLNDALLEEGTVIKAGDFLGLAGNSGSSTGPHLHIHIRKETEIESGPFRPLLFNTGYAIYKGSFASLSSNADWSSLASKGLPGYASSRAFIWPSSAMPVYGTKVYNGVFRAGTDGHALWTGATAAVILQKDNTYKNSGLRMTDLSVTKVGNNLEYSAVWRAGAGVSKVQTSATWAAFTNEWSNLSGQGYRLLDLEVFTDANGNVRYAGVYGAGNWGHQLIAGLTQAAFNAKWAEFGGQGYKLVDVEVYKPNGTTLYAGVFKFMAGGSALWHAPNWASFKTKWNELHDLGYRLVDLDTDGTGGSTIYSGTFLAGNDNYTLWESNWNSFRSFWDHCSSRGLRIVDFNVRAATGPGFGPNGGEEFAGDFGNEEEEMLLLGPSMADRSEMMLEGAAIKVFPNPVADQFALTADSDIQSWSLLNSLGAVVQRGAPGAYTQNLLVQVDELPSGLYYLIVHTAKGTVKRPVEVLR